MNKTVYLFFLYFFALSLTCFGEGTKQLRPDKDDKGNLCINHQQRINGTNTPMYTDFGEYGAKETEQIKIKVKSTTETIYFGMNNKEINGGTDFIPNVPFHILDPNGDIVYQSTMPEDGEEGNIATWEEAVNGPQELGNAGGYDALTLNPAMTGDYVIEFDPSNSAMDIHLFDVTVADENNQAISGRLHSKGWQISTEDGDEEFQGKVYPYDPKGVVYEVDFNGMQPFTFVINFNSIGTDSTDNILVNRRSKEGKQNFSIPEFDVFLNPPDSTIYPTFTRSVDFSGEVTGGTCLNKEYCLNFTSDVEGYLDGYIDVNKNSLFDEDLDVLFSEYFPKDSTMCVPWDGNDAQGNPIDVNDIKVMASFGLSITHLPMLDVEDNQGGLKVKIVSPENLPDPLLFWDDSNISEGDALDRKVNLNGCNSSNGNGCHSWEDRGSNNNPETINTWWYTKVVFDTLVLNQPKNPQVNLSFSPSGLQDNDTTVCLGDSVNFYIHNDTAHYDATRFNYTWFFNTDSVQATTPELKSKIEGPAEIVIKSSSYEDFTCITLDTLNVSVVEPIEISATVTNEGCDAISGSVMVTATNGPSNPVFTWKEFPESSSSSLSNLTGGSYNLTVKDPAFSDLCALDTTFTIAEVDTIIIEKIDTVPSVCYSPTGEASITMANQLKSYNYSWNGEAFTNNSSIENLSADGYAIRVQDPETGCEADSSFTISALPFSITLDSTNEVCSNSKGSISISTPAADFDIIVNGSTSKNKVYSNLQEGSYSISVVSTFSNSCKVDTVIEIENEERPVKIDSLNLEEVICGSPTGSAEIFMPSDNWTYEYSFFGEPYGSLTKRTGLSIGNYEASVRIAGSSCKTDTSFIITGSDSIQIETVSVHSSQCYAPTGSAAITMVDETRIYDYNWNNTTFESSPSKNNLAPGAHSITVKDIISGCTDDTAFQISPLPLNVNLTKENEHCKDGLGRIDLTVAEAEFNIVWNGNSGTQTSQGNLSEGTYQIEVISTFNNSCRLDTVVTLLNENKPINITQLIETPSNCAKETGEVEIVMPVGSNNYEYNLNNEGYLNKSKFKDLPIGTYPLTVRIQGTGCKKDTTVTIAGNGFTFTPIPTPDLCASDVGTAEIAVEAPNVGIKWDHGPTTFEITSLSAGTYTITISNYTYTIPADFSVVSTAYKERMETGAVLNFTNTTAAEISSSAWNFGNGTASTETNPQNSYSQEGIFTVSLSVTDSNGCTGQIQKPVTIKEHIPCGIAIPNAFSPNGDGQNDDIGVLGYPESMDLKIFNRWGEVIFRATDIKERWNGIYRGSEAPIGVYPFTINYQCPDENGSLVKKSKVGEITSLDEKDNNYYNYFIICKSMGTGSPVFTVL